MKKICLIILYLLNTQSIQAILEISTVNDCFSGKNSPVNIIQDIPAFFNVGIFDNVDKYLSYADKFRFSIASKTYYSSYWKFFIQKEEDACRIIEKNMGTEEFIKQYLAIHHTYGSFKKFVRRHHLDSSIKRSPFNEMYHKAAKFLNSIVISNTEVEASITKGMYYEEEEFPNSTSNKMHYEGKKFPNSTTNTIKIKSHIKGHALIKKLFRKRVDIEKNLENNFGKAHPTGLKKFNFFMTSKDLRAIPLTALKNLTKRIKKSELILQFNIQDTSINHLNNAILDLYEAIESRIPPIQDRLREICLINNEISKIPRKLIDCTHSEFIFKFLNINGEGSKEEISLELYKNPITSIEKIRDHINYERHIFILGLN